MCMQGGASRDLFDAWCGDVRNGLLLCDFAVQGTLAREVLGEPSHVLTRHGAKVSGLQNMDVGALICRLGCALLWILSETVRGAAHSAWPAR